jgi:hypothetical protein
MCQAFRDLQRDGLRYVIVDVPIPRNVSACFRRLSAFGGWRLLAHDSQYRILELGSA